MGYGPLVRAAAGMTRKWCYGDDPDGFSDSITIYPDHVCGRIGATAALALLLRRNRTGRGGRAEISQAEVMLNHLAAEIAGTALGLPDLDKAPDAPWGVFQAAGDDEWCVVTVRNDDDWRNLASAIDDSWTRDSETATRIGRLRRRESLNARLADWIAAQDAEAAAARLQQVGVPAARMLRVPEQPQYRYFEERGVFRIDHDDLLPEPLVMERRPAIWSTIPDADNRPAPLMGQDTHDVISHWLELNETEIARLETEGVLETVPEKIRSMIADGSYREVAK
jgi:crotonobetainyl-CoA:carnitine CoA-transferase CaiB-like acyl-CoA transferase